MNKYLASSEYIDWENPELFARAKDLASGTSEPEEITLDALNLCVMK